MASRKNAALKVDDKVVEEDVEEEDEEVDGEEEEKEVEEVEAAKERASLHITYQEDGKINMVVSKPSRITGRMQNKTTALIEKTVRMGRRRQDEGDMYGHVWG